MMKKLMVLSLVLAVAGLANASLALVDLGAGVVGIESSDAKAWAGVLVWSDSLVLVSDGFTANGNGGLSETTEFGKLNGSDIGYDGLGAIVAKQIAPGGTPSAPILEGLQWTSEFAGVTFGAEDMGLGQVVLLNEDLSTVLGTLYVVPEPMTMGLLSLGALFIRRRK